MAPEHPRGAPGEADTTPTASAQGTVDASSTAAESGSTLYDRAFCSLETVGNILALHETIYQQQQTIEMLCETIAVQDRVLRKLSKGKRNKHLAKAREHQDKDSLQAELDSAFAQLAPRVKPASIRTTRSSKRKREEDSDTEADTSVKRMRLRLIVVCIRCHEPGLRCDYGKPCEDCKKFGAICRRARCDHSKTGECIRRKCTRAHELDGHKGNWLCDTPHELPNGRRPRKRVRKHKKSS